MATTRLLYDKHTTMSQSTMIHRLLSTCLLLSAILTAAADEAADISNEEPHPDPNEEDYTGMAYIGRMDDDGRRVGFDQDNGECDSRSLCSGFGPLLYL